ncbi:hypothetical protein EVAR_88518_1 [Eumeta japonica]|uniref:Uncharacterized protein n=1 Tax=Eumeta variegata TaxID=151549 RepID=A0A4C1WNW8_EUMVA|nr:hypothetical protein EVAR_88518_1 [Eumeta japonica]
MPLEVRWERARVIFQLDKYQRSKQIPRWEPGKGPPGPPEPSDLDFVCADMCMFSFYLETSCCQFQFVPEFDLSSSLVLDFDPGHALDSNPNPALDFYFSPILISAPVRALDSTPRSAFHSDTVTI